MAKKSNSSARAGGTSYDVRIVLHCKGHSQELQTPVSYVEVATAAGNLIRQVTKKHPPIKLVCGRTTITGAGDFDSFMTQLGDGQLVHIDVKIDRENSKAAAYADLIADEETTYITDDHDDETATLRRHDDQTVDDFMQPIQFQAPFTDAIEERRSTAAKLSLNSVWQAPAEKRSFAESISTSSNGEQQQGLQTSVSKTSSTSSKLESALADPLAIQALSAMVQSPKMKPVVEQITSAIAQVLITNAPIVISEFADALKTAPGLAKLVPDTAFEGLAEIIAEARRKQQPPEPVEEPMITAAPYMPLPTQSTKRPTAPQPPTSNVRISPRSLASRHQSDGYLPLASQAPAQAHRGAQSAASKNSPSNTRVSRPQVDGYMPLNISKAREEAYMPLPTNASKSREDRFVSRSSVSPPVYPSSVSLSYDSADPFQRAVNPPGASLDEAAMPLRFNERMIQGELMPGSITTLAIRHGEPAVVDWRIKNIGDSTWAAPPKLIKSKGDLLFNVLHARPGSRFPEEVVHYQFKIELISKTPQTAVFQLFDEASGTYSKETFLLRVHVEEQLPQRPTNRLQPTPSAPLMSVLPNTSARRNELSLEDPAVRRRVEELASEFGIDPPIVLDILAEEYPVDYDRCRAKLMYLTESTAPRG